MKELQAKAKVTQTMTRDGLVVENQADGTVENVSSREAEQDYSTALYWLLSDCRQSPGIAGIFYCIHRFSGIMILSERRCFL